MLPFVKLLNFPSGLLHWCPVAEPRAAGGDDDDAAAGLVLLLGSHVQALPRDHRLLHKTNDTVRFIGVYKLIHTCIFDKKALFLVSFLLTV